MSLVSAAALVASVLVLHALGPELARAAAALPSAQPILLCLGCGLFVVSALGSAMAWRTSICACGGRLGRNRAAASFGIGSLVNTLLPARAGDGVRVALFSRAAPEEGRVSTTGGIFVALGVARAAVLSGLVVAAAAVAALPVWPLAALAGVVAAGTAVAMRVRGTRPQSRFAHLLDAFRALGSSPPTSCRLVGWEAVSLGARFAAATATAASLGDRSPLLAALVIVPAMELTSLLPLTPGNLGITSGAVAVALRSTGMHLTPALTIGIALHAVETLAGLGLGGWSLLYLAGARAQWLRRLSACLAGAAAVAAGGLVAALIWI